MDGITFTTGGSSANTGIALKRLGFEPMLIGRTGDDYLGQIIRNVVQKHGLSTDFITVCEGETSSYTIVLSPPSTDRAFLHYSGTNDSFTHKDVKLEAVDSGVFHFGYPPLMRQMCMDTGKNLEKMFKYVKSRGLNTSLDMAPIDPNSDAGRVDWEELLRRVLPHVDFFLPSLEELLYMVDRESYQKIQMDSRQITIELLEEVSLRLFEWGANVVVIKLGDQGLYFRTSTKARVFGEEWINRQILSPVFEVDVQGTTGAGDSTIAGFLAGFIRGYSPEEVVTLATGVGGCSVEALSATEGIPSLTKAQERIEKGWLRVEPVIHLPNWKTGKTGVLFGTLDRRQMNLS